MEAKTDGYILAWLLLSFVRHCHPVEGFLDIDELKSVHYGLDILSEPVVWTAEDNLIARNNIKVTSKHGQNYKCSFPDRMEADKKKEEEEKVAMETGIPELLKPLETGPCLFKSKDWWTYEFCYGKHVRHFHVEDGKVMGEITFLGYYESEFDWNNKTDENKKIKNYNRLNRYHSQQYINGTRCDLTGRPRRTEVRFVCDEGSGDSIDRIDEPETCVYVLTVHTTRICHHPYLKPPTKNTPIPITCQPVLSDTEFLEYTAQKLEQEQLKAEEEKQRRAEIERMEQEKLHKLKLDQERERQREQGAKSTIEDILRSADQSLDTEPDEEEDLKKMMEQTLGNNKKLEQLLQSSLDEEIKKYKDEEEEYSKTKSKPVTIKMVRSMEELREAVRQAQEEAEAYEQSEDDDTDTEEETEIRESEEDDTHQKLKYKKMGETLQDLDENLDENEMDIIEEFEKDLEEMDTSKISKYKEYFKKNKKRFLSMKKKIQDNMIKEFDNIVNEAGDELGMTEEEMKNLDKEETFSQMADILNKLLAKLDKTEKDIKKVDREISMLKEKSETSEDSREMGDENSAIDDTDSSEEEVIGPDKSDDDRVKIRVTKLKRGRGESLQAKQSTQTEMLEKEVKEGLEKAGLDVAGGNIQVKIITAGYMDDDNSVKVLSDEESKTFTNMIVSILEGGDEAAREEKHHSTMEENYNFVWGKDKKKTKFN